MMFFSIVVALVMVLCDIAYAVDYDIVYIRAPRYGDSTFTKWADVMKPTMGEPNTDLMLLRKDGSEELLVAGGVDGMVVDPAVSFDGQWVYYAHFPNVRIIDRDLGVGGMPIGGSDLYKIHIGTRQIVKLTHGEWTPKKSVAPWSSVPEKATPSGTSYIGHKVFNTAPCPLPGGKVMFTSTRNGLIPTKFFTFPNFQLFVLDEVTGIVEEVGYLNLGSALHPTVLMDGRVMFSSYEAQGLRDARVWGLWAIWPDGRNWEPLASAFMFSQAFHWQTQRSDGQILVGNYYNGQVMGALLGLDYFPIGQPVAPSIVRFGQPNLYDSSNPSIPPNGDKMGFSPLGLKSITPFATLEDRASPQINGQYVGKVAHPSAAPNNTVLVMWSPGPAHAPLLPAVDGGIYVIEGAVANTPSELRLVKNDVRYNEQQAKALVPYQAIYGIAQPAMLPWLPNDGTVHPVLPKGTPFGLIGTSTHYKRNTAPAGPANYAWFTQGADAGVYENKDIHGIRLVLQEPHSHIHRGPGSSTVLNPPFWQMKLAGSGTGSINERLKILGEIPLRKVKADGTPLLDIDGNPDTSFLAKIPADHVFTFQMMDKDGSALNTSQTWHQVRPGEVRTDCGGCHAHSQVGTDFAKTAAGQPGFVPVDLTLLPPLTVEWNDVKDIISRTCSACTGLTGQQVATQFAKPFQSRISELITTRTPSASDEEKRKLRTWIDLGGAVSLKDKALVQNVSPWREWNTKPSLHVMFIYDDIPQVTCPVGCVPSAVQDKKTTVRIGAFSYNGVIVKSVTVKQGNSVSDVTHSVVKRSEVGLWEVALTGNGEGMVSVVVEDGVGLQAERKIVGKW